MYSNAMRSIHSPLFTEDTIINYLVELTTCWMIFVILSGTCLLIKKHLVSNKSKVPRWQKWYVMVGVIIAIPVLVLVLTGLPWLDFMGSKVVGMVDINGAFGQSELAISPLRPDLNELPWATRKSKQPASSEKGSSGYYGNTVMSQTKLDYRVSIGKVVEQARKAGIKEPFSIVYPNNKNGTFTVSNTNNSGVTGPDVPPCKERILYLDQYSGKELGTIKYNGYDIITKRFTWGILPHEDHLFGILSKITSLLVYIALLVAIDMGLVSWIKRTKNTAIKVLHRVKKPVSIPLIICLAVLGLLMPLFGLSLILVFITELVLYVKDHRVKQ